MLHQRRCQPPRTGQGRGERLTLPRRTLSFPTPNRFIPALSAHPLNGGRAAPQSRARQEAAARMNRRVLRIVHLGERPLPDGRGSDACETPFHSPPPFNGCARRRQSGRPGCQAGRSSANLVGCATDRCENGLRARPRPARRCRLAPAGDRRHQGGAATFWNRLSRFRSRNQRRNECLWHVRLRVSFVAIFGFVGPPIWRPSGSTSPA